MKALRVNGNTLSLETIARPNVRNECAVRVVRSGICNTDLEIVKGYAGFTGTLGHEFVGIVETADAQPELVGRRVVGEINVGCGRCEHCSSGDSRHCPRRTVLGIKGRDGCHAEYLTLPAQNLFEVPDEVSDHEAVFAEPLAAAIGIAEQVEVFPETRIAVIGDGKLGLLCARSLALLSPNVVLIGRHREKLRLATVSGIETSNDGDAVKRAGSFDLVVEASGAESGFQLAVDLVRPRGKMVLKSTFQGRPTWEAWRVVVDEISIIGSRCGRFAPALKLLASKRIEVKDLIDSEFEISRGLEAFETAGRRGVLKVLLTYP